MRISGKHKIYFAILALAGGALLVDRIFLGTSPSSPAAAKADTDYQATDPAAAPPAAAGALQAAQAPPAAADPRSGDAIADRLSTLASERKLDAAGARDAFSPSPAWMEELRSASPSARPREECGAEAFRRRHQLMAVMTDQRGGYVIIVNGKALQPGQTLEGYTLVSVGKETAVFDSPGGRVELRMAQAPQAQDMSAE